MSTLEFSRMLLLTVAAYQKIIPKQNTFYLQNWGEEMNFKGEVVEKVYYVCVRVPQDSPYVM